MKLSNWCPKIESPISGRYCRKQLRQQQHTLTHTITLTLTHTHTLSHTHNLTYTHSHTRAHTHTLTHTNTYTHTNTHTHTYTHKHIHSHTHTHTLKLTHTHKHTHCNSLTLGPLTDSCVQIRLNRKLDGVTAHAALNMCHIPYVTSTSCDKTIHFLSVYVTALSYEYWRAVAVFTVSCTVLTIRTAKCNTNTCTDGIFNLSIAVEVCSLWFSFRLHWNRVAIRRLGCMQ
jgi:hypothetical protein